LAVNQNGNSAKLVRVQTKQLNNFFVFNSLKSTQKKYSNELIYKHLDTTTFTDIRNIHKSRMWANAQCDGHPAEYRWRPLFNTAKFG